MIEKSPEEIRKMSDEEFFEQLDAMKGPGFYEAAQKVKGMTDAEIRELLYNGPLSQEEYDYYKEKYGIEPK